MASNNDLLFLTILRLHWAAPPASPGPHAEKQPAGDRWAVPLSRRVSGSACVSSRGGFGDTEGVSLGATPAVFSRSQEVTGLTQIQGTGK